jgi:ABC-type transport system involved in cytochrome c biogenesis permease component
MLAGMHQLTIRATKQKQIKKLQLTSLSLMVFEPAVEYMLSLDYSVTVTDRLRILLPVFIYPLAHPVANWYLQ